jgi:oligopeptide transport system substrate-binding protein
LTPELKLSLMFRIAPLFFLVLILFGSCRRSQYGDSGKTVFRYNESAGITSLDPAFCSNQANIWAVNQLYKGLVQLDDNLHIKPCIAKHWEISNDGLTYRFHLRNDAFFHDSPAFKNGKGRKVVASDFVYSFNRIADPGTASPGAWVFGQVLRKDGQPAFRAIDDSTLRITLKTPFPPFLGLLTSQYCSVVPREAVEKFGIDFRRSPVGTGPFSFKMWKEGVKLVMIKNDHYFEIQGNSHLPYLDAIAVTFIVDKQAAFLEFVKGNLDFMSGIDASYKDELLTREGKLNPKYNDRISLVTGPYLNTEYLGILVDTSLSQVKNSPLRILKIRQAINCAFDRKKMMRYLRNNIGLPGVGGMVPPGLPYFDQSCVIGYDYDPARARQLLAEAGFPGGKGLPPITLTTNASYLDLCKYIQSQLNEAGFIVKIDVTPPGTLRDMIALSRVNFFRGSWIADYPDAENYLSLYYTPNFCPAGPNYTHFSNPEFDAMYRYAANETNDSIRGQLYMKMDNLVMEQAPVVVLYYDQVLRFTQKNIVGIATNPLNLLSLKHVKKTH